jgi:hypothetical protein
MNVGQIASQLASAWAEAQAQVRSNPRLRMGLWLVLGMLWVSALLNVSDWITAESSRTRTTALELDRLRSLAAQSGWEQRVEEASQQLSLLQGMTWAEPERGLAEAAMQDWVTALAAKAGITLREHSLLPGDATDKRADGAASGKRAAGGPLPGYALLRMRLSFELNPKTLSAFLMEISQAQQVVRVERLRVLQSARPALVELELVSVAQLGAPRRP